MSKKWLLILIVFSLVSIALAIPQTFNINGKLTDSNGVALAGDYNFNFSIYNNATGGTYLWNSGVLSVTTDSNGIYHVILNNVNLNFSEQYFLGIRVGTDSEMSPRLNLTSSPYAYMAQNVTVGGIIFDSNIDAGARNFTTTGTGFFGWLGSLTSRISGLFVNDINVNGTFNVTNASGAVGLYVNQNGNVGIGTSTPSAALHLNGSGRSLLITDSPTSYSSNLKVQQNLNYYGWGFGSADTTNWNMGAYFTGSSGENIIYYKSTAGKWTSFANAGDVGQGFRFTNEGRTVNFLSINASSGNVGINTTSPTSPLHINRGGLSLDLSNPTVNQATSLRITPGTAGTTQGLRISATEGSGIFRGIFGDKDGVSLMTLIVSGTGVGNVGIGTITPSNKLDVRGDINASGMIYYNNGTAVNTGWGNVSGGGTAGYIPQWANATSLNDSIIYQLGGNVSVGTTAPAYKLDVRGGAHVETVTNTLPFVISRVYSASSPQEMRIGIDDTQTYFYYINDEAQNKIIFRLNNTDMESGAGASRNYNDVLTLVGDVAGGKVGIKNNYPIYDLDVVGNFSTSLGAFLATSSGNVGIGTTTPSQKLDVSGSINASGNITLWGGNSSISIRGDGGALTEQFGYNSRAIAAGSTAIGNTALANGSSSLAVGYGAKAYGASTVAMGKDALTTNQAAVAIGTSSMAAIFGVVIGNAANASSNGGIAIGQNATAVGARAISIGENSATTAANQLVIGGPSPYYFNNEVYIGSGVTANIPVNTTYHATGAIGTDMTGGYISIAGGRSTGNATGGEIRFETSDAGASGTTLRSLTEKMRITGPGLVGIGTTRPGPV